MRYFALILMVLLMWVAPVLAAQKTALKYDLTSAQKKELEQEKELRLIQRRVFDCPDTATALRQGIAVLQSFGFYIEQVFPLENLVQGISSEDEDLLCALEAKPVPGTPGKVIVWFNLHQIASFSLLPSQDVIRDKAPYQQFFKAFAQTVQASNGGAS